MVEPYLLSISNPFSDEILTTEMGLTVYFDGIDESVLIKAFKKLFPKKEIRDGLNIS